MSFLFDDQEQNFEEPFQEEELGGNQEFNNENNFLFSSPEITFSDSDPESPEMNVVANGDIPNLYLTDVSNLKAMIATKFEFSGHRVSYWLRGCDGIIIMPVDSVGFIRKNNKEFGYNPKCILYAPNENNNSPLDEELKSFINILKRNE